MPAEVTVAFTDEEYRRLRALANERGEPIDDVVSAALRFRHR